jgi:hypothetical protein
MSRPARHFFSLTVVVDRRTGRITTGYTAQRKPAPAPPSLWTVDLPGTRRDTQRIRAGGRVWPVLSESEVPGNLAIDAAGYQTALWYEWTLESTLEEPYRVLTATRPAGGTWSTPTVLDSRPRFTSSANLAVNGSGDAVALWVHNETNLYASYRSSRTGPWSSPQLLARRTPGANVGLDAAGNALVMYGQPSGAWVRRRDVSTGTWGPVTRLDNGPAGGWLAVSANGTATASWLTFPPRRRRRLVDREDALQRHLAAPGSAGRAARRPRRPRRQPSTGRR